MKIVCISDTHTKHREVNLPKGDILLHAGDLSYFGDESSIFDFNQWLGELDFKHKVVIAGNHDRGFEDNPAKFEAMITNATYLNQSSVEVEGLKIWGEPRTPWFYNWAFNIHRDKMNDLVWSKVPKDTNILLTHGPPGSVLDITQETTHVGCEHQRRFIVDRYNDYKNNPSLKLIVCGHIHESRGTFDWGPIKIVNASVVDRTYSVVNDPIVIEL